MVAMNGASVGDHEIFRGDWPCVTNSYELTRALLNATSSRFGVRVPGEVCSGHGHFNSQWSPPPTFGVVFGASGSSWFRFWSDWVMAAWYSKDPASFAISERTWLAGSQWHFEFCLMMKNVPEYLVDLLGEKVAV